MDDSPPTDGDGDGSGDESFDFTNGWTDSSPREDDTDTASDAADDGEPLGDLARRLDEREGTAADRGRDGDAFDELDEAWAGEGVGPSDADELFEEMDISNVDTEALWDSVLDDTESDAGAVASEGQHDHGMSEETDRGLQSDFDAEPDSGFDTRSGSADEPRETTVAKDSHCESCYFFTSPPEVGCTYDGSEIVEIVDSERFRVRNCPVVAGVVDTDGDRVGEGDELASEASD